jgi:arsenate reductase
MKQRISTRNTGNPKKVLFVCTHNRGRSQMAEAIFNRYAPSHIRATSAGSQPGERLNQTVVNAMKEIDIDISQQRPKLLTTEMLDAAAMVIVMGCGENNACPAAFVPTIDWELDDPEGQPIRKVRGIRDRIEIKVKHLIKQIEKGD